MQVWEELRLGQDVSPPPGKEQKDPPLLSPGARNSAAPRGGVDSKCSFLAHSLTVTPQTVPPCNLILLHCGLCIPDEPFMEN